MVLVAFVTPAAGFHTVFDFTIDRFEADGNLHGPLGGPIGFVDDFDDPALANWYTPFGTSSVSGGRLHVQSPGRHLPGPDGLALDLTEVASHTFVQKGSGDFVATAIFDPVIPPDQHFYHFTLYTYGGPTYFNELFGVDIHTLNGATIIEQHLVELDLTVPVYRTVQTESQVVTANDVTGQIYFRVAYNDTAGTVVSSFSLDGGNTFHSPFSAAPIMTQGRNLAQYILGADPRVSTATTTTTTPAPTTTTTLAAGACARLACDEALASRLDLRLKSTGSLLQSVWRQGTAVSPDDLGNPLAGGDTGYTVCLRQGSGPLLFDRYLPAGATWKTSKNGFRYADGTVSMAVTSGPAGRSRLLLGIRRLQLPSQSMVPLTVQVAADTGACWVSHFAAEDVKIDRRRRLLAVKRAAGVRGGLNPFLYPSFDNR